MKDYQPILDYLKSKQPNLVFSAKKKDMGLQTPQPAIQFTGSISDSSGVYAIFSKEFLDKEDPAIVKAFVYRRIAGQLHKDFGYDLPSSY